MTADSLRASDEERYFFNALQTNIKRYTIPPMVKHSSGSVIKPIINVFAIIILLS